VRQFSCTKQTIYIYTHIGYEKSLKVKKVLELLEQAAAQGAGEGVTLDIR